MQIRKHTIVFFLLYFLVVCTAPRLSYSGEQPIAIFHAFDQQYSEVERFVCSLAEQGYSHIQVAPAQKSNPDPKWWARYQPVDYATIEGRGSEDDLRRLIAAAHACGIKVIADVVLNHMADMEEYRDLNFPNLSAADFHHRCGINYADGDRISETECWLGGLPDLDQTKQNVQLIHKAHLRKLLGLGVDGFRFDAAKHMPNTVVKDYIDFIDRESRGNTWNYLEVISDGDTSPYEYNRVAAVTDFVLYNSMKEAFSYGGDLRALRLPQAILDSRSVTFGRNHDNIREINTNAISPYDDRIDSYLATAYVLAREAGTPLVLNWDNADAAFIRTGVKFRRTMHQRAAEGKNTEEFVLAVIDSPTLLMMERGEEGFFVVNKGAEQSDIPALDLTLTRLEGCYRELGKSFTVAVQRRDNGKKYVTRWGSWNRGGMQISGRNALFFTRESWDHCR